MKATEQHLVYYAVQGSPVDKILKCDLVQHVQTDLTIQHYSHVPLSSTFLWFQRKLLNSTFFRFSLVAVIVILYSMAVVFLFQSRTLLE